MHDSAPLIVRSRRTSLLRLDLYRLIHTPVLYIMLLVSAIIPAMILSTTGADGAEASNLLISNAWQLIESTGGSAAGAEPLELSGYANINMVFIFVGLLMAIFVSHDYSSGFVKSIFTVHSRRADYVISKSVIGFVSGAGMILAYVLGTVVAGLITGKEFDVSVAGLILCILSKIFLMAVFCSLFLAVSLFFRDRLWATIIFTFLLGMMLYPAASIATLDSTLLTAFVTLAAGAVAAIAIGAVSTLIASRRDLA